MAAAVTHPINWAEVAAANLIGTTKPVSGEYAYTLLVTAGEVLSGTDWARLLVQTFKLTRNTVNPITLFDGGKTAVLKGVYPAASSSDGYAHSTADIAFGFAAPGKSFHFLVEIGTTPHYAAIACPVALQDPGTLYDNAVTYWEPTALVTAFENPSAQAVTAAGAIVGVPPALKAAAVGGGGLLALKLILGLF